MDADVLELIGTFFGGIWDGLTRYNVPGTDWPFSGFLIAIFTAGIIGKICKTLFDVFGSHLDSGFKSGRSSEKRSRTDEPKKKGR